jgi:hypothetical protein
MGTSTLVATYREGDKYIVEADVDCLSFRYAFTDPDVEKELLFQLLDDEDRGMDFMSRYEVMDLVQAAIDSGNVDRKFDFPPAVYEAADVKSDGCCACDAHKMRADDWKSIAAWSFFANVVLSVVLSWCYWGD